MKRSVSSYLMLFLKGIGMGAADVIPGVSGGTIAFMTGIYNELIQSIKSIDLEAAKLLFTGKIKQFWEKINGNFLVAVFAGVLLSIFTLAKVMVYLLDNHPIAVWSFFFGLIISSVYFIVRGIDAKKWSYLIPTVAGVLFGATICLLSPAQTPDALWFIFLCGAIAICAMILPGISGSFILLLLGKYDYVLNAASTFNIGILLIFLIGAIIGIISFSHFLSWLLKKYYNGTLLFLAGLMVGSLLKVWPWQRSVIADIAEVSRPVWPTNFTGDPQIAQAIIWAIVGAMIVFTLEFISIKMKKQKQCKPLK